MAVLLGVHSSFQKTETPLDGVLCWEHLVFNLALAHSY